jgi:hypothetical protein
MEKNSFELNHNRNGKLDDAIRQEVVRIADGWVPDGDPSRNAALVMIVALFLGPDADVIATTMGIDPGFVQCVGDRLRASGLWTEAGTDYSDWSATKPLGIVNFGLDLDVAEGVFTRTAVKENGQYGYTLVGDGTDIFE